MEVTVITLLLFIGYLLGLLTGFIVSNWDVKNCLLRRRLIIYRYCWKTKKVQPFWINDGTRVEILP